MKFKEEIEQTIQREAMFRPLDKLLVALSGGADSVALLRVLLQLGYACEAAHCNFHLRGEESNRDEKFVCQLCKDQGIHLHIKHFDTEAYAKQHQLSIEMAARELRYSWFHDLLKADTGLKYIAVAHHRDDNIETLLINLVRGTGIHGLTGIPSVNGTIVRPLLDVSRSDILAYLDHIEQSYVTDSTNLQDDYLRNKIRHNLLPMLETMNPSVRKTLSETIRHLKGVAKMHRHYIQEQLDNYLFKDEGGSMHVRIEHILEQHSPEEFLYAWLHPLGFNSSQLADIHQSLLVCQPGKRFLSKKWEVLRDRELLLVRRSDASSVMPELEVDVVPLDSNFQIPTSPEVACVDADLIELPLTIRKWEEGDSFVPFGMRGKKSVCKYMTDRKFSLFQKENQFVALSNNRVVWLIGERLDNRFRISETTRRICILRIKK